MPLTWFGLDSPIQKFEVFTISLMLYHALFRISYDLTKQF
jgi:hypothetical protein